MRVATFNIHAGVDGWGRRQDAVAVAVALEANLLFVQELWRGEFDDQVVDLTSGSLRLVGEVPRNNHLGIRFARRAGFEFYGINKRSTLRGGVLLDQVCLGISKADSLNFPARQG